MKSGWELSQRTWRCSRGAEGTKGRVSGQSRVGDGSSSTLCELFPAIRLESNEKLKALY